MNILSSTLRATGAFAPTRRARYSAARPRRVWFSALPEVALAKGPSIRVRASVLVALLCLGAPLASGRAWAASDPEVHGLALLPGSRRVGEDRYRSPRDWQGTLKFFRERFRGSNKVRWHRAVNLPAVKYIHLQSTHRASGWSGLNIYQLPNGEVRLYVLPRVPEGKGPQAAAAPSAVSVAARGS